MNSGTQDAIPSGRSKPSSPDPQPYWKISTTSPYAVPTDSRFNPSVSQPSVSDRNDISMITNVSSSTNAPTSGAECDSCEVPSADVAVIPLTRAVTPGTA